VDGDETLFQAELTEHRSMGEAGTRIVVFLLLGISAVTTVGFVALGAWPVAGFAGVEVFLAVWLLSRHRHRVRREMVRLTPAALVIDTQARDGRWLRSRLRPDWLWVRVEDRPGTVPKVLVAERGRGVEVGTVLNEPERRAFAAALARALDRMRSPNWDAPER